MEHNQGLPMVNPQGQLSLQTNWLKSLLPEETQILRAKYGAQRFGTMTDEQIDIWGDAMLLKIAVITGWVLPSEKLQVILLDQFKKKMTESYANCNPEEVEYAFRNYGSYVKDWGKQMNLNMIDEVMQPYLTKRREQSFAEERATPVIRKIGDQEDLSDEAMEEWLARETNFIKTGKPFELVPLELYEYLVKKKKLVPTKEAKFNCLERAVAWRASQLEEDIQQRNNADTRSALSRFKAMKERGYFTGIESERIKNLAKKLLFFDYIQANY